MKIFSQKKISEDAGIPRAPKAKGRGLAPEIIVKTQKKKEEKKEKIPAVRGVRKGRGSIPETIIKPERKEEKKEPAKALGIFMFISFCRSLFPR